jgi:hypothetical protein
LSVENNQNFDERLASFGSPRYRDLRDPQRLALDGYSKHAAGTDIAIELPTGYGKTLVALLIADQALEQGKTVAYLCGNNQLVDQVLAQAEDLPGLAAVKFSGGNYPPAALSAYHGAQALAVMNYWTYFNSSPRMEPGDVVMFDDAHLAEQPLAGLFGVRIERRTNAPTYQRICDLVMAETDLYPSVALMRDGDAGPGTPPELIAFKHWSAISSAVAHEIPLGLTSSDRRFVWPDVRQHLLACGLLIGPHAIELRPYHPPTQTHPGYRNAKQRIYFSATLGTPDDLQRRLGILPATTVLDTPVAAGMVGDRLFLLNPSDDDPLADVPFAFALQQAEHAGRVAWLCASHAEADGVEALLGAASRSTYRLRGGSDDDVLDRWAVDPRGHLITAGRYDGLDLSHDLCRLIVLPSVPAASSEFERFVMAYLGDATFMRHRVGQRVTQALGRANRDENDWAMYLGLAPGFGTLLAQSAVQAAIPSDVRPVIDSALQRLEDGWAGATSVASAFWASAGSTDPAATPAPSSRTRPGRLAAASSSGSAQEEVRAVTRMWLADFAGAASAAEAAAELLASAGEAEHAAFWQYTRAQAMVAEDLPGAGGRAIEALRLATEGAASTPWFVRLRRVLADIRGDQVARSDERPWSVWDEWLRESGAAGVSRAILRCNEGLSGTHDQQSEAIELLGRILGVDSHRPHGQAVTDAIWSWSAQTRVEQRLWEVKTGDPDKVPRDWVDQSLGQIAEVEATRRHTCFGCVVTHLEEVDQKAAAAGRETIVFVHVDFLLAVLDGFSAALRRYSELWGTGSAVERGSARDAVESLLPREGWIHDVIRPGVAPMLRRDHATRLFD